MRRQSFAATILIGKNALLKEGITKILHAGKFGRLISVTDLQQISWNKGAGLRLLFLIVHAGNDIDAVIEQIGILRERYPDGRIAVIADNYRLSDMVSTLRVGASGYFVDVIGPEVFIKSLELISMGETVFPPAFASTLVRQNSSDDSGRTVHVKPNAVLTLEDTNMQRLSTREEAILRCLIAGESNKSIARKINIAEATVKAHIKSILRKIRVQNRTQAAIWALNSGGLASSRRSEPVRHLAFHSESEEKARPDAAVSSSATTGPLAAHPVISSRSRE